MKCDVLLYMMRSRMLCVALLTQTGAVETIQARRDIEEVDMIESVSVFRKRIRT